MARRKVDRVQLYQRTDQELTISRFKNETQVDTSGEAITAYLYAEGDWTSLTGGIDVTSGSPTGAAVNTDITVTLDTLTGITLTKPTWYALYVIGDGGTVFLPNDETADVIMVLLHPMPS